MPNQHRITAADFALPVADSAVPDAVLSDEDRAFVKDHLTLGQRIASLQPPEPQILREQK